MNREIKFRAWNKEKRNMFNIARLDIADGTCYDHLFSRNIYDFWNECILMQYTGLKDINGKEIYEGDIVKIPNDETLYGYNAGEKYQVYFAYGGFRLKPKYDKNAKGFWLEDDNELEVIGNIYENPELLES